MLNTLEDAASADSETPEFNDEITQSPPDQLSYFNCSTMDKSDDDKDKWLDRHWWRNKGRLYRYFAMLNICLLGFGANVCFDSVGALEESLMDIFQTSYSEFSLMYSIDSLPNIVLGSVQGFLIDRLLGVKVASLLYGMLLAAGHMVFSSGVLITKYWCALLGRFISGTGNEFLILCSEMYCVKYFKEKELCTVLSVSTSISKLGSSVVYSVALPILSSVNTLNPVKDVAITLYIVGAFSTLTFVGGSVLAVMNPKENPILESEDLREMQTARTWRDFVNFPVEYWLVVCMDVSLNVFVYCFLPFTQDFFMTMNGMTAESANSVASFFSIAGVILAPFTGIIIDKMGKHVSFSIAGLTSAFMSHLILGFFNWTPYIGTLLLSLAFAILSGTLVSMYAFVVPEYKLATALAIAQVFYHISYCASTYLAGLLIDNYGYRVMEIFMLSSVFAGVVASIVLWIKDARGSGILNMTTAQRNKISVNHDKGNLQTVSFL